MNHTTTTSMLAAMYLTRANEYMDGATIQKKVIYAVLQGRSTLRYENEVLSYLPLRLKVVKGLTDKGYTVTQHGTQHDDEGNVEGFIIISWPPPEPPMQHIDLKIKYDKGAMSYD